MSSIEATGAESIGVTHGSIGPVVRYLNEKGKRAFAVPTRWEGEAGAEEGGGDGEERESGSGGAGETQPEAECAEGLSGAGPPHDADEAEGDA
jgi:putative mRNA 3-end processing factor